MKNIIVMTSTANGTLRHRVQGDEVRFRPPFLTVWLEGKVVAEFVRESLVGWVEEDVCQGGGVVI